MRPGFVEKVLKEHACSPDFCQLGILVIGHHPGIAARGEDGQRSGRCELMKTSMAGWSVLEEHAHLEIGTGFVLGGLFACLGAGRLVNEKKLKNALRLTY
jgi:hypothetical protein